MKARVAKPQIQEIEVTNAVSSSPDLQQKIAEAAYYRAERRGFQPGFEMEDWLAAESEIRTRLASAPEAAS
jgi:hypothetical protein